MENKNLEVLDSFIRYHVAHSEQRFWQALRNWSGKSFILVSEESNHGDIEDIQDTFYWEGRDG